MNTGRVIRHVLVMAWALFILSCGQSPVENARNFIGNRAPVIDTITDDLPDGLEITNGMNVLISLTAHDPDGDPITYRFETDYGSFSAQTDTGNGCTINLFTNNILGSIPAIVTVTAKDISGASSSINYSIGNGQTGPGITIDSLSTPVTGCTDLISAGGSLEIQFQISSKGGYKVEVLNNVGSIVSGDTEWYYYNSPGTVVTKTVYGPTYAGTTPYYCNGEGNYTVRITAKDLQDQESTSDTPLGVDATPPMVNAGTDRNSAGSITQNGSVTDTDGNGIRSILWEKDSGTGTVNFGSVSSSTTSISASAEGVYVIRLTATDRVGNSASDTMIYNLDIAAPTVNITSPSNGNTVYNAVKVSAYASDSVSGVSKVEFYIDGAYRGDGSYNPISGYYEYSWNTTGYANGSHSIKAVAYDMLGHTGIDDDTSAVINNFGTKLLGTATSDFGYAVATDAAGNIYVTGAVTASLDGEYFYGGSDMFVAKYDPNGVWKWTRQLGSTGNDHGEGIAVDSGGNVYVTGRTSGSFDENQYYLGTDWFVVKYNSDGVKQWSKQRGQSGGGGVGDAGNAIAVSDSGYVYATGYTNDTDIIIIRLASDTGNYNWVTIPSAALSSGKGVAVDSDSNVYITGNTGINLNTKAVLGYYDAFIIKYNSDLSIQQWVQQFGTGSNDYGNSIAVSGDYLYVTGYTGGSIFESSQGGNDIFITKREKFTGSSQWIHQYGTSGSDIGRAVTVHNDKVYITGDTSGHLDGHTNSGGADIFITQYSSDGNRLWTRVNGTGSSDKGYGVSCFGNFEFLTGFTDGNLGGTLSNGSIDIFLIRYDSSGEQN
ncbi:MAG TPA: SBBP repeat-containing protein [Spirochaetota bacterium]|nr:SBBP repeat-containing protein [Spirochaetota bacterium]